MRAVKRFGKNAQLYNGGNPLDLSEMERRIPSAWAVQRNPATTSERYVYISTAEVIRRVMETGWQPVRAAEVIVRKPERAGYAKHLIVFRNFNEGAPSDIRRVGDTVPELMLTNAHDTSSSLIFMLGLFRMICENGLIVADGVFESFRIRHNANTLGNVIDIVAETVDRVPRVGAAVRRMQELPLETNEVHAFGKAAAALRWDDREIADSSVEELTRPTRSEDAARTLWNTYNVVQERLTKGVFDKAPVMRKQDGSQVRQRRTAVRSVNENIRINKALWTLSQELAKAKGVDLVA